jgi:hypothetical protein
VRERSSLGGHSLPQPRRPHAKTDPHPTPPRAAVGFGELWSIQESLLQSYRSIFITVEAVLFALATFGMTSDGTAVVIGLPIALLGLLLIPAWMAVCNARARAVTFVHWMIQRFEAGEDVPQPYTAFRQFQTDRMYGAIAAEHDPRFRELSRSKTRQRMDRDVPRRFAAMCVLLLLLAGFEAMA